MKILNWCCFFFAFVISILFVNLATFTSKQPAVKPLTTTHLHGFLPRKDAHQLAERLSQAIRFETISYEKDSSEGNSKSSNAVAANNSAVFLAFHDFLRLHYAKVFAHLKVEVVNELSLMLTWVGENDQLKPAAFLAHLDVVPVDAATRDQWVADPFEGALKDGFVYGRGSMDDKMMVIGLLEAVEELLAMDYRPARTILLLFGHDEEVSGFEGAKHIVDILTQRYGEKSLWFVLDEGMPISRGAIPGLSPEQEVATIGTSEKGSLTVELVVKKEGGHSSMPPPESVIGMTRLEANPVPSGMDGPANALLDFVGPEMSLFYRFIMANRWLFGPLLLKVFSLKPSSASVIRTTTAVTIFRAGIKSNVLPSEARAVVNHRIHPRDTIASVLEWDRAVIDDERVEINVIDKSVEASPMTDANTAKSFRLVQATVLQLWPNAIVAPGLMIANTDTRHYWKLTDEILRFCPQELHISDVSRIHGVNERMKILSNKKWNFIRAWGPSAQTELVWSSECWSLSMNELPNVYSSSESEEEKDETEKEPQMKRVLETAFTKPFTHLRCWAAPMVGMSELAFRMLCRKYGAHVCSTPMIDAAGYAASERYRAEHLFASEDRPLVVQFCGNRPQSFVSAGRMVESICDAVEINLGCPQACARKGRYGAFLMNDVELVCQIIREMTAQLAIPVFVKCRIFSSYEKTLAFVKAVEEAGASCVTVHARTRAEKRSAETLARWDFITKLCQDISIPIIANGNIRDCSDVEECFRQTNASGVMSATALLHNPALFSPEVKLTDTELALEYLQFAKKYGAVPRQVGMHLFKILKPGTINAPLRTLLLETMDAPARSRSLIKYEELEIIIGNRAAEKAMLRQTDGFERLCTYHLQGRCNRGEHCEFVHSNGS